MRTTLSSLGLIAGVLAMTGAPAIAQPAPYTIQDLGTLGGNTGSAAALGLNDEGFVTGWSTGPAASTLAGARRPFLFNPLSLAPLAMRDLLPGTPGSAVGQDLNTTGFAVGTLWQANAAGSRGFVVGGPGAVVPPVILIDPLPGGTATTATDINDTNWVVGTSNLGSNALAARPTHAILWRNGQTTDLGTLGGRNSEATAISQGGVIVGVSDLPATSTSPRPVRRGFVHPGPGYSMIALSALHSAGSSRANDISDTAIIVGAADWPSPVVTPFSPPATRAVLWTPATTSIVNLGTLRNTDRSSEALAVNDAGLVVGWSGTPANAIAPSNGPTGPTPGAATRAFVWHEGTMYDLNTLIPPNSGWILQVATDINQSGQIVGWGRRTTVSATAPAQIRAFLLTPMPTDADR